MTTPGIVVKSIYVNRNGGADFKSIQEAIGSVPLGNDQWIRVHVAAGIYNEKVSVPQNKSFILLEGEGEYQTSIEWSDHAGGDSDTASSPTFAVFATDFMARDIAFKNTYKGDGQTSPAVAALVAGDRASYRCAFISLQDTLCDLEGRHYYEGCYVVGTTDFIFGNGQTIFQSCRISTAAMPFPPGFITAQGRSGKDETTGFVFRDCTVDGVAPTYLGRAWRAYARVIFYRTDMSNVVVREGWDAWNYKGSESTLTMAEAECTGQGANRTGRVPWSKTLTGDELAKFVSVSYVSADGWLNAQPH
ncbi:hypothetical protein PR202_gb20549 [Eleusine coracana subsp. coracana]|uniref:Pectinesterase n=1 Tax=Eleusine coracana subsp. coracana TaxID=191504 RepID=A0AAV5FAX3_ELECO|nr:hypothetical protein PR202_gb20549 [Eleusine coracana subsp. coracana]